MEVTSTVNPKVKSISRNMFAAAADDDDASVHTSPQCHGQKSDQN